MAESTTYLLGVGANLGDRHAAIRSAYESLSARFPGARMAPIYESAPMYDDDQPPYLNTVIEIRSALQPAEVLAELMRIEREHGRMRDPEHRFGARTLDLDIVAAGPRVVVEDGLTIPHPRMHERAFVLLPATELRPDWVHPVLQRSMAELLSQVVRVGADPGVWRLDEDTVDGRAAGDGR